MKQTLLLSFFLAFFSSVHAQRDQWTWVSGDNSFEQYGVYGIKGAASAANKPGARQGAVGWTDASGNLWIFGGSGNSASSHGFLNDLWKYTIATGQWTWISGSDAPLQSASYGVRGVSGPNNVPGARSQSFSFTDISGNFWIFGGTTFAASGISVLNDLWKYSPSTNQWTWMSGDTIPNRPGIYGVQGTPGAANKPGARSGGAAGQIDAAGNIWLYGGGGIGSTISTTGFAALSDLWKYSISSGQWTWVSGANTTGETPVFGTKGTAAAANKPGAKSQSVGWTDVSGNFWLFGGQGSTLSLLQTNDLWKYDVLTGLWTWISGSSAGNQSGVYGIKGVGDAANTPGARTGPTAQRDVSGNLLLFGGVGRASIDQPFGGFLNDLWRYSTASGQWTWINGDNTIVNSTGIYGSKGTPAAGNKPGARSALVSYVDPHNNFWIFSGLGFALIPDANGNLNDLWQYTLPILPALGSVSSFTAQKQSQTVTLNWTTSQDQNIRSFSVERYNGTVAGYQSIGTVPATVSPSLRYSFTDNAPWPSTNYYRIQQVDQTGRSAYSSIAQVAMDQNATQFNVYQNPVQNLLQLVIQLPAKQQLTLQVRDLNGRVLIQQVHTGYPGRASFAVPVGRLSKGAYVILLQSESINSIKTFIKQ